MVGSTVNSVLITTTMLITTKKNLADLSHESLRRREQKIPSIKQNPLTTTSLFMLASHLAIVVNSFTEIK